MRIALLLLAALGVMSAGCVGPPDATRNETNATDPLDGILPTTMPSSRLIVAFGDSYTEGFGTSPEQAYPALLTRALDRTVLNKGVSGQTAGEGARRLDRDVIRNSPELVIIEFGVNEAYRGYPVERSLDDLEAMVQRIREETDAKIILVGVHFWTFQENFDAGLRNLSERYETGLVLDVLHGIVSSQRDVDDGDPKLRHDAFHPNAAGYALMSERIQPVVQDILAGADQE